ncbi:MAG TPA: Holliday junction branch migration protein RuvA [Limnobacter sp.]|uniref:Holliday junction branch migration protein RuvA n=1 Tax=Limnobacter sp. TaxID=2003368 RepID=UPI002ED7E504
MIGRLKGTLAEKNAPWIVLDVQGVGYELQVPMSTFFNLPELNAPCTLNTHLVVREDAHSLYGFASADEKTLFKTLIKVSGIGPRTALAILSSISTQEFLLAVQSQETARLVKIPGIGKKTAERLLLELKGQIGTLGPAMGVSMSAIGHSPVAGSAQDEIIAALCALGYSDKEAAAACKGLPDGMGVTDGLKLALRNLSKG